MHEGRYYPIFIDSAALSSLIVGGGGVGCRKLAGLLDSGAQNVLVLDTAPPSPELSKELQRGGASFRQGEFQEQDLDGRALVFTATGNAAVNAHIAGLCRARGIFCNCADAPRSGNFIVPALARTGALTAALSTSGASPALARQWKEELQEWLQPRAVMAEFMGRLRPLVLALRQNTGQNTQLFRSLARSPLQGALHRGDSAACGRILTELLPPSLRERIPELLHELV